MILSSNVWSEKFENTFEKTQLVVFEGVYKDTNPEHKVELAKYVNDQDSSLKAYNGQLNVVDGVIVNTDFTMIHARSVAEDIKVVYVGGNPYTGSVKVTDGKIVSGDVLIICLLYTSDAADD